MTDIKLSKHEEKIIKELKSIAKRWPSKLWIFAGSSGGLVIMRTGKDGKPVHTKYGGVDPDYVIDEIDIPADGGDF